MRRLYATNSFVLIFSILLTSFFITGGCNDNNGNGEVGIDPPTASACTPMSQPCEQVTTNTDMTIATCGLSTSTCGVDLMDVINQVGNGVTTSTTMWIQAWGGSGGDTDKGTSGGAGGFAQTTTTVEDISSNLMTTQLFYFLGGAGPGGGDHCGSTGGTSTIVTTQDLTLNPSQEPDLFDLIVLAGAGGGGCAGNGEFGCDLGIVCQGDGAGGGAAIANNLNDAVGIGSSPTNTSDMGGSSGQTGGVEPGEGGQSQCNECGGGNQAPGEDGVGGIGGTGGSGQDCSAPGGSTWSNTGGTTLTFINGAGGKGSSNTNTCDAGGGGGGGGYGGGGGGGHGNDNGNAIPGGGGGSFGLMSTKQSSLAPTTAPGNPNGAAGFVQIQFCLESECDN
jgi:hypothetical protein